MFVWSLVVWLGGCGSPCSSSWYADRDGDGFGDRVTRVEACDAPAGHVSNAADCNDDDDTVFPEAPDDTCNGVDENCDGVIDDEADTFAHFLDADRDGAGNAAEVWLSCDGQPPPLYTATAGNDCDDFDPLVGPGQPERCNGVDDDCDGDIDEDAIDPATFYPDNDGDGFGAGSPVTICPGQEGSLPLSDRDDDCNDANAALHPDAAEVCNDVDDDCDGLVDNDAVDAPLLYADYDFDGWGAEAVRSCDPFLSGNEDQPFAYYYVPLSNLPGDCDDFAPNVNPGEDERCNGFDDDCDGDIDDNDSNVADEQLWYRDRDDDGFGDSSLPLFACDEPVAGNWSLEGGDCEPDDPDIHPEALEVCNSVDDDCDGDVDDDDPDLATCP